MNRRAPETSRPAPQRPADTRPRHGATSFDQLLTELLSARTRYEAARTRGTDRLEMVAWRSKLHDLRYQIATERRIRHALEVRGKAHPPI
jgi:hypothetical protein